MFKVNDVIVYGAQGVCKIVDIEEKTISRVKRTYYVLKPVDDKGPTIFAPTDNERVLQKIRRLLSRDEVCALIASMPKESAPWIANERERG